MIKLLLFALVFYVSYNLLGALLRGLKGSARQVPPEKTASGEDMVRDPQCGTFVPRSDALHKSVGGQTHYFCSQKCRDDYLAQTK